MGGKIVHRMVQSRLSIIFLTLPCVLLGACDSTPDPYAKARFLNNLSGGGIILKDPGPKAYVHPGEKVTYEKIKLIQWQVAQEVLAETSKDVARIAGEKIGAGIAYGSGLAPDAPPEAYEPRGEYALRSNQLALTERKYQERELYGVPPILPSQATPP
jgi:hypothetical protein